MKKFYEGLIVAGSNLQSLLLLAIRLFWGYQFFISGWGKFQNMPKVVSFFQDLGIPFPELNAYLASGVECIGGLMLLIGFGSRLAAIPLAFTMVVAMLTAHSDAIVHILQDPDAFVQQAPFNYLLTCLIVFAFGPGAFSIDYLLEKLFNRNENKT